MRLDCFLPIRRDPMRGGVEFPDLSCIGCCRSEVEVRVQSTERRSPQWAKDHPVLRIEPVQVSGVGPTVDGLRYVKSVATQDTGGGILMDWILLDDTTVLGISDEVICLYPTGCWELENEEEPLSECGSIDRHDPEGHVWRMRVDEMLRKQAIDKAQRKEKAYNALMHIIEEADQEKQTLTDGDDDANINGGDLVEWFVPWIIRAMHVVQEARDAD